VKTVRTLRGAGARPSRGRPASDSFTLAEVASCVRGRLAGDPSLRLSGVQGLESATPSDLSWVADERRRAESGRSQAGALLVSGEADAAGKPAVIVSSPALALAEWLAAWKPPSRPKRGISKRANVHASARLGPGVSVAAGATVEENARVGARSVLCAGAFVGRGAVLGEDCYLHANAAVLEGCRIGARGILHTGAVVGADGFGYVWDGTGHRKIPQLGIVRVEDDVEIGANATIDRATLGETVIGRGTKIDNLVQIGHNVVVGEHSILCGQAGIAGSSRLGRRVTLAGQVGIGDHVIVPDGVVATGQAGVFRNSRIPPGTMVSGMPAVAHRDFLRSAAWVARLPELARRVERLEKKSGGPAPGEASWKSESPKS
jgi:UDP-3-O-[3-hydroxymyristoyl] glucosamine N-acyltransferase